MACLDCYKNDRGFKPNQPRIIPDSYRDTGLVDRLNRNYSSLPKLDEFDSGIKYSYLKTLEEDLYQKKSEQLGFDLQKYDGLQSELARSAGISTRQIQRLNSMPEPDLYGNLVQYRGIIDDFKDNNPIYQGIEKIVNGTQNQQIGQKIVQEDIKNQVMGANPEAKMYALVDELIVSGKEYTEVKHQARKIYFETVAEYSDFDEEKIKQTMGKEESSTTVSRMFERQGLDFKKMKSDWQENQNKDKGFDVSQERFNQDSKPKVVDMNFFGNLDRDVA